MRRGQPQTSWFRKRARRYFGVGQACVDQGSKCAVIVLIPEQGVGAPSAAQGLAFASSTRKYEEPVTCYNEQCPGPDVEHYEKPLCSILSIRGVGSCKGMRFSMFRTRQGGESDQRVLLELGVACGILRRNACLTTTDNHEDRHLIGIDGPI